MRLIDADKFRRYAHEQLESDKCYTADEILVMIDEQPTEIDTCEWIKYDYRTIVPKNHDADNPYWRIPENMDKLKYCPYCGKEIVVK